MANDTPMMKQYRAIKERNQDSILFFRLGDFYEMFDEDAKTASRELDLMLTTRDRGREEHERTPMCGVPYHSAESYIARLIAKGYKVAICEQMEDPATAKGLVDRDIIRIITPGTRIDASMLDESKPNYLCSMYKNGANFALAFVELSTGEFVVTFFPTQDYDRMFSELCAYSPAEVIMNGEVSRNRVIGELIKQRLSALVQTMDERFEFYNACRLLTEQFGVKSAEDLPIGASQPAICAAGALLSYLADTQKVALGHINKIRVNSRGDFMELDIQTLRNLELVQSLKFGEKRGSLLWVLDKTVTPMGRRMIRSWVMRPLLSQAELMQRHTAVGELAEETVMRSEIRASLREVSDIERIISKIVYGTANGRDVKMLGVSIRGAQPMFRLIQNTKSGRLSVLKRADTLADLAELIEKT
ncbi:MAG: DNA mismatch repair protein MutS, partial [Oscillospiraceae bacterium]|nr:DNA mismatch repair protein MutS [Oscillospiraceae bacterium]